MTRESFIHDVLWATGTHELCRKDEGPPVLGKRSASGASSSSAQQPDELMETFLAVAPVPRADARQFYVQHFDVQFSSAFCT